MKSADSVAFSRDGARPGQDGG